jgi:hypothetical protein
LAHGDDAAPEGDVQE